MGFAGFSVVAEMPEGINLGSDPCDYFGKGKVKASTLSLSVLVVIEMLNAFNALSEDGSLLQMPPWKNPMLILAIVLAVGIHMVILYVPLLNPIFSVVPLNQHDWNLVWAFSFPVILVDEVLKFVGRTFVSPPGKAAPRGESPRPMKTSMKTAMKKDQ